MAFRTLDAMQNWMRAYVGNASSVRDYRSQLRGTRSVWLWGAYLGILILITIVIYTNIVRSDGPRSIVLIQSELKEFYQILIGLLGGLVCLVTPAMSATSVVAERQRRSLDLVFSAPVEPSYYLLGKMLSCLRYTWMLLILSLPVASVGIVMGGASWGDLLASYVMLSMIGLVFSAIGLLISTLSTNLISSIIYSYIAVGAYLLLTFSYAVPLTVPSFMGRSNEMLFAAGMNPIMVGVAAPTHTTILNKEIPNWLIVSLVCLVVCKTLVMASASILSYYKSRETKLFRIWGLGFIVFIFSVVLGPINGAAFGSAGVTHVMGLILGYVWAFMAFFLMPHLFAYGLDSERRYWFDGDFNLKAAFEGTPAGALPYALMQWFAMVVGTCIGSRLLQDVWPNVYFWHAALWALAFTWLFWCVGRWTSELARNLRAARIGVFMTALVLIVVPIPLLSIIQMNTNSYDSSVWVVYIMYPLSTMQNMGLAFIYALLMAVVGTVLYSIAVSRRKLRINSSRPTAPPAPPVMQGFEV